MNQNNVIWKGKWITVIVLAFVLSVFAGQEVSAFRYVKTDVDRDHDDNSVYSTESPAQPVMTPIPLTSETPSTSEIPSTSETPSTSSMPTISPTPTVLPTPTILPTPSPAVSDFQFTLEKDSYAYTGNPITPKVTVQGKDGNGQTAVLKENVDYALQYEDNVNYGVGRVIILGQGSYSGYHVLKFGILPEKVSGVKVKSPFYMENTVTWKKAAGADGYYIYRKEAGQKEYSYVANVTDANFQVFHDRHKSLKKNKKYDYQIVAYVSDPYYDEDVDGNTYRKPKKNDSEYDYSDDEYKNSTSYYSSFDNSYYNWYSYSVVKGKCVSAFEATKFGAGSGKVTTGISGKRYTIYTGDADIDYMAYLINKKIIKKGMSDDKRVQAIYRWMVKNCTFTKDVKDYGKLKKMKCYIKYNKASTRKKAKVYEDKIMKQIYQGKALCIGTSWHDCERAVTALAYRKGSCSFLTPMFNILCNQAGVEAYIVDGYYVNRDKSKDYHNWSFVKLGRKYYWYDVPVACKNKNAMSAWYKKGTKYWKTCHQWSKRATKGYAAAVFQK